MWWKTEKSACKCTNSFSRSNTLRPAVPWCLYKAFTKGSINWEKKSKKNLFLFVSCSQRWRKAPRTAFDCRRPSRPGRRVSPPKYVTLENTWGQGASLKTQYLFTTKAAWEQLEKAVVGFGLFKSYTGEEMEVVQQCYVSKILLAYLLLSTVAHIVMWCV